MITDPILTDGTARTRTGNRPSITAFFLAPALAVVVLLFGGGLLLGLIQSLGYLPAAGFNKLSLQHFSNILTDRGFIESLSVTLNISILATVVAASASVFLALALSAMASENRLLQFIFQIPLTVPHLVVGVALMFMLSPAGLISRTAQNLGLVSGASAFPLLVNDSWGIGIILAYVWKEVPFITLMLLSVLHGSGRELLEVGKTLKASRFQRFRYITLPTLFPSLGAACLIVFAYTFGAFEIPFLLGRTYPMLLPVWAYKSYSDVDLMARPEGIATGMIIALAVVLAIVLAHLLIGMARRRGAVI
jgi:putative spermidine/putrescine transport system permease protein